jgi:hypothetical protein
MAFYLKGFYDQIDNRAGGSTSSDSLKKSFSIIITMLTVTILGILGILNLIKDGFIRLQWDQLWTDNYCFIFLYQHRVRYLLSVMLILTRCRSISGVKVIDSQSNSKATPLRPSEF